MLCITIYSIVRSRSISSLLRFKLHFLAQGDSDTARLTEQGKAQARRCRDAVSQIPFDRYHLYCPRSHSIEYAWEKIADQIHEHQTLPQTIHGQLSDWRETYSQSYCVRQSYRVQQAIVTIIDYYRILHAPLTMLSNVSPIKVENHFFFDRGGIEDLQKHTWDACYNHTEDLITNSSMVYITCRAKIRLNNQQDFGYVARILGAERGFWSIRQWSSSQWGLNRRKNL